MHCRSPLSVKQMQISELAVQDALGTGKLHSDHSYNTLNDLLLP